MTRRRAGNRRQDGDRSTHTDGSGDEVRAAASGVEQARAALQRADQNLERWRSLPAESAERSRAVTIGGMLDDTLDLVRRHPLSGLLAVGMIGFLLGRSTRR